MRDNIRPWSRPYQDDGHAYIGNVRKHEAMPDRTTPHDWPAAEGEAGSDLMFAEPLGFRIRDVILVCIGLVVGHIATVLWR